MRRLPTLLAGLAALALLAVGCNGGPVNPDAATVNGTHISRDSLVSDAKSYAALDGDPFQLHAQNPNTLSGATMAQLLYTKITDVLVADAAKKYGLEATDADVAGIRKQDLGPYAALPADKLTDLLRRVALQNKLVDYLTGSQWWTDDDINAYYKLVKDRRFDQACVKHILVADEATANQIVAQLKAGGDFAKIAAAQSTDTSNKDKGGDLGCNGRGSFVTPFENAIADAHDGDLIGPVKTDFGYHVISVTSGFRVRTLDEVRDQIVTSFKDSQAQGWVDYQLRSAKVSVDRRYGRWNTETLGVTPPEGAKTNTPNVNNPPK